MLSPAASAPSLKKFNRFQLLQSALSMEGHV
jgi:hypothetical protein